jgi:hypothetical protein
MLKVRGKMKMVERKMKRIREGRRNGWRRCRKPKNEGWRGRRRRRRRPGRKLN